MTPTDSLVEPVETIKNALELERVDSHLHPEGSFRVEDHPVPEPSGQALNTYRAGCGQSASVRRHDSALLCASRTTPSDSRPSSPYRTSPTMITSVWPYSRASSIM